jgi:hypothetical protein
VAEEKAYIAGGHVYCRVAHEDRDVEQCMRCLRLKEIVDRVSPPYVVCEGKAAGDTDTEDPRFIEWWHQHHRPAR